MERNLQGMRRGLEGSYVAVSVQRFSASEAGASYFPPNGNELADLIQQCLPAGCKAGIEQGLFVISAQEGHVGVLGVRIFEGIARGDFYENGGETYERIVFVDPAMHELLAEHSMTPEQRRMVGRLQENIRQRQYVEPMNEAYGDPTAIEKDW